MTELDQPADLVAGHYRILGRARTDQETITYRAEDVRSRERVALLVLRDSADDSASALNAFRVGIHRWFGLEHPTLPEPLEAGHDRGVEYAAAEWPGDIVLSRLLRTSQGLSAPRAVDIGIQMCSLFTYFRASGLSTTMLSLDDITLNARGDIRCAPAAVLTSIARGADGSPPMDVARIGGFLRELLGAAWDADPTLRDIILTAVAPDPSARHPTPAALAQALASHWQQRWNSLPRRAAYDSLALPHPAMRERPRTAVEHALPFWDSATVALVAVAVVALLGLIPLWASVYARYTRPLAVAPLPTAQDTAGTLVPDLTGLDEATAWALLEQQGLHLLVASQEHSDDIPLGSVIRQMPPGGQRVPAGSTVHVVLSQGTGKTIVPDVVGQPYATAETLLAERNLNALRQEIWSEQASDLVVEQEPEANAEVVPGTTVVLRTSAGRTLSIGATLGDVAQLLTVEPDTSSMKPGETLQVALRWRASRGTAERLSVFVHMVSEGGVLTAQHDGEPANGSRPTTSWVSGDIITDIHLVTLPESAPAGTYTVRVGLYLPGPNQRVPVVDAGQVEAQDNALIVHTVTVLP